MMHSKQALYDDLQTMVGLVDSQIDALRKTAEEMGVDPNLLRYQNGEFAMVGLLNARIMAVAAMANLKASKGGR